MQKELSVADYKILMDFPSMVDTIALSYTKVINPILENVKSDFWWPIRNSDFNLEDVYDEEDIYDLDTNDNYPHLFVGLWAIIDSGKNLFNKPESRLYEIKQLNMKIGPHSFKFKWGYDAVQNIFFCKLVEADNIPAFLTGSFGNTLKNFDQLKPYNICFNEEDSYITASFSLTEDISKQKIESFFSAFKQIFPLIQEEYEKRKGTKGFQRKTVKPFSICGTYKSGEVSDDGIQALVHIPLLWQKITEMGQRMEPILLDYRENMEKHIRENNFSIIDNDDCPMPGCWILYTRSTLNNGLFWIRDFVIELGPYKIFSFFGYQSYTSHITLNEKRKLSRFEIRIAEPALKQGLFTKDFAERLIEITAAKFCKLDYMERPTKIAAAHPCTVEYSSVNHEIICYHDVTEETSSQSIADFFTASKQIITLLKEEIEKKAGSDYPTKISPSKMPLRFYPHIDFQC